MFDKSIIAEVDRNGFDALAEIFGEFCKDDGKVDYDAVHSIAYGFMVAFDPRRPKFNVNDIPEDYPQTIKDMLLAHHHYYTLGKTAAHCVQVTIIFALGYFGYHVIL